MSRVRGIFPLFLATTFGIVNGIWVFGPALKEQQQKQKDEQSKKAIDVVQQSEVGDRKTIQAAEAAASRSIATESALKPIKSSSSPWRNMFWSKAPAESSKGPTNEVPRKEIEGKTNNEST